MRILGKAHREWVLEGKALQDLFSTDVIRASDAQEQIKIPLDELNKERVREGLEPIPDFG